MKEILTANVFKSIGHPIRIKIILILYNKREVSVSEISQLLNVDQPIVSLHLSILKKSNVLNVRREGKMSYYSIGDNSVKQAVNLIFHSRNI